MLNLQKPPAMPCRWFFNSADSDSANHTTVQPAVQQRLRPRRGGSATGEARQAVLLLYSPIAALNRSSRKITEAGESQQLLGFFVAFLAGCGAAARLCSSFLQAEKSFSEDHLGR
jgi:hypothetical protein